VGMATMSVTTDGATKLTAANSFAESIPLTELIPDTKSLAGRDLVIDTTFV
jgi:hypothetical protein